MTETLEGTLEAAIARAETLGASACDGVAVEWTQGSVRVRMGEVEEVQRARQKRLGIRVLWGSRQAMGSTSDLRPEAVRELVERTCATARLVAEDAAVGLPDPAEIGAAVVERPDLFDPEAARFDLDRAID